MNGNKANLYPACPGRGFAAPNVEFDEADEVLFFMLLCLHQKSKSIYYYYPPAEKRKREGDVTLNLVMHCLMHCIDAGQYINFFFDYLFKYKETELFY